MGAWRVEEKRRKRAMEGREGREGRKGGRDGREGGMEGREGWKGGKACIIELYCILYTWLESTRARIFADTSVLCEWHANNTSHS